MTGLSKNRNISGLKYEPKLTWEKVNEIRSKYQYKSSEFGCLALAKEYGVNRSTIHKIVTGITWKTKLGDSNVKPPSYERYKSKKNLEEAFIIIQNAFKLKEMLKNESF